MRRFVALCFYAITFFSVPVSAQVKSSFEIKDGQFLLNGKVVQIHSGEMHYARIPREYWAHRLKMLKAMGMNTVATYVFWNYHTTAPGVWDFQTGNKNLATFIKTAQAEGLMVMLRPGPYACAEWEFGGYPWWLQKNKDLVIRANNKAFLDSCRVYINKLAEQVRPLQVTTGGPIVMVQVENEFGSYVAQRKDISLEEHKKYNTAIKQLLVEAGFEVPFFTSDGSWLFEGGTLPNVLPTANGESNIDNLKKVVDAYYPFRGPYMVAEFYPGWLDHWNEPFVQISTEEVVKQTEKYLQQKIHFNFYMAHGGTNFAFTSGANYSDEYDIQPDITSYDYDAPISEAGWATPKFYAIRELMKKYSTYSIPEVPEKMKVLTLPDIPLTQAVDFFEWKNSITPVVNDTPLSFEELNQGHGFVLYSRVFNQPIQGRLSLEGLRDYAIVYVNGKKVGELNRQKKQYTLEIDVPFNGRLEMLVENMGRINYGAKINSNTKGVISPVLINGREIAGGWKMYSIPLAQVPELEKVPNRANINSPAFYTATFELKETGDLFLDMSSWGKGIVFVNGNHIGRYWNVGPQQTLYVPGCWLEKGKNQITIFEQQHDTIQTVLKTRELPVLNQLNK